MEQIPPLLLHTVILAVTGNLDTRRWWKDTRFRMRRAGFKARLLFLTSWHLGTLFNCPGLSPLTCKMSK